MTKDNPITYGMLADEVRAFRQSIVFLAEVLKPSVSGGVEFGLLCPTDKRPCNSMCAAFAPACGGYDAPDDLARRCTPGIVGRCTRLGVKKVDVRGMAESTDSELVAPIISACGAVTERSCAPSGAPPWEVTPPALWRIRQTRKKRSRRLSGVAHGFRLFASLRGQNHECRIMYHAPARGACARHDNTGRAAAPRFRSDAKHARLPPTRFRLPPRPRGSRPACGNRALPHGLHRNRDRSTAPRRPAVPQAKERDR